MNIRPAVLTDAPVLAKVHVDSWRAAYRELVPDSPLQRFTYEWREECFRQSLATNAEETYVVQLDEEVVGFLTVGTSRDQDLKMSCTGEIWESTFRPTTGAGE